MRWRLRSVFVLSIAIPLFEGRIGFAQITVDPAVVGSSGGAAAGGTYTLEYILGEPILGNAQGGAIEGQSGFWWTVVSSTVSVASDIPSRFSLGSGTPNPFSHGTDISFGVPKAEPVRVILMVYDLHGRVVKTLVDGTLPPGRHTASWDGRQNEGGPAAAGIYFLQINAGAFVQHTKLAVLK